MQIIKKDKYLNDLQKIMDFIAKDSIERAFDFEENLEKKLYDLPNMPYKFRQSIYFDDENIRDFIFKGYVIPYLVDMQNNLIAILGVNKYKNFTI